MADVEGLKSMVTAYGIAVRAGVLTPNIDDEIAIRVQFGLPPVNDAVRSAWAESHGVRFPITLAQELDDTASGAEDEFPEPEETDDTGGTADET